MPDFWARLGRDMPDILASSSLLRRETMNGPDEGAVCPKKVKELIAVAIDTVLVNQWGREEHLRAAMLHGATVADVREVQGLGIMEVGMVASKLMGVHFLAKAEAVAAALAG
jgi:alkylhydroperoxidase/carboxymuconolactone decarboxylase family protein YurZ